MTVGVEKVMDRPSLVSQSRWAATSRGILRREEEEKEEEVEEEGKVEGKAARTSAARKMRPVRKGWLEQQGLARRLMILRLRRQKAMPARVCAREEMWGRAPREWRRALERCQVEVAWSSGATRREEQGTGSRRRRRRRRTRGLLVIVESQQAPTTGAQLKEMKKTRISIWRRRGFKCGMPDPRARCKKEGFWTSAAAAMIVKLIQETMTMARWCVFAFALWKSVLPLLHFRFHPAQAQVAPKYIFTP
jgi:hypothetical protein